MARGTRFGDVITASEEAIEGSGIRVRNEEDGRKAEGEDGNIPVG